jgi:NADH oxidase (H2O2-forming)
MEEFDIVVVGCSAAGLTAAIAARRHYPAKAIVIVRQEEQVLIPCGIPISLARCQVPRRISYQTLYW